MVISIAVPLTRSACLLASFVTIAVPSVLSRHLLGQWRINYGARLGPLKIENEKVVLICC